jgi:hypothetical protein
MWQEAKGVLLCCLLPTYSILLSLLLAYSSVSSFSYTHT